MINQRTRQIIEKLAEVGVEQYCVCAGARNAPLVAELNSCSGLQNFNFFDERSAAFFALGRIEKSQKPVVVVTTSGTAVAELLPAVVEAHYRKLPLILLTADRPAHYRHSGAPQSILQVGIFSHYVSCTYDIGLKDYIPCFSVSEAPIHINVSFSEENVNQSKIEANKFHYSPASYQSLVPYPNQLELEKLNRFFQHAKEPLVIISGLRSNEAKELEEPLFKLQRPIYAESTSNLCGSFMLSSLLVYGGEQALRSSLLQKQYDSVIRVGGVPTCRFWRDLEDDLVDLPVLSVSQQGFTGLAREHEAPVGLIAFSRYLDEFPSLTPANTSGLSAAQLEIESLFTKLPLSEPAQINGLSKFVPDNEQVFLGNSLPIREWDLFAEKKPGQKFSANRGVNGIDGLVSTALGWSDSSSALWCILGDLSSLYDLSGLWALKHSECSKYRGVVINNGGGKIFSRKFSSPSFENNHHLDFSGWAKLFDVQYLKFNDIFEMDLASLPESVIIEIVPDAEQSGEFWVEYEKLWKRF